MEKIKIEDLKENLYCGDLGEYLTDYNNGYIGDIITEIADNKIDIYNSDLIDWAKGNISYIEEALSEFGTPTNNRGQADFMKIIQQGQYLCNEQDLYNNLEDNLKFFMYDYIEKDLKIKELTENQNNNLLNWDFTDNNEQLENLIEHIENVLIK